MPFEPSLPENWLLDVVSALNLLATGQLESIIGTPVDRAVRRFALPARIVAEANYLRRGGDGPEANDRLAVDWTPFFQRGHLELASLLPGEETSLFVSLAQNRSIDDGEAECLAIAGVRGWGLVTDDGSLQKIPNIQVPLLTTADLIKNWSDVSGVDPGLLADCLLSIKFRARHMISRNHPLRNWWLNAMAPGSQDQVP